MSTVATAGPVLTSRSGHTATVAAYLLSLVTPDSARARHIRSLVHELDEIALDRAYAARMVPESTRDWKNELSAEERQVWRALRAEQPSDAH